MKKAINYTDKLKAQETAFQQQARDNAALAGQNPETIFAISHTTAFNIQPVLEVVAYTGPKEIAESIDSFIFSYLQLLSQSEENGLNPDVNHTIWVLKNFRDALFEGYLERWSISFPGSSEGSVG